MGMRMLVNEAVEVTRGRDSLWIAGVDDPFDYACDNMPGALACVPEDGFKILLAHTPQLYKDASLLGVDVYLCGHTHGGQIRFPLIGSIRDNCPCPKDYTYQRWSYGRVQGYTSAGTGSSGLPVRFNCPPEIGVLTLHRS
jgi:predicted MPP superfamily phosphohydrolase